MDLRGYNRIVVKVGSALLVDGDTRRIRTDWLQSLCEDIAQLHQQGKEIVVVSSGAIALGRRMLPLPNQGRLTQGESQAAAIRGQHKLVNAWDEALSEHDLFAGQLLLTKDNILDTVSAATALVGITEFISMRGIPVINENDAVDTAEIKFGANGRLFGDNDQLAAHVSQLVKADLLILLSDVDGLYTADPGRVTDARHIAHVARITPEIVAMGGGAKSAFSNGGMKTKIAAAEIATSAGCAMVIAKGETMHPVRALSEGAQCTLFEARVADTGMGSAPAMVKTATLAPKI